ncbi:TonB-dependent siderophore receptor [Salinisphaera sp. C84B14]
MRDLRARYTPAHLVLSVAIASGGVSYAQSDTETADAAETVTLETLEVSDDAIAIDASGENVGYRATSQDTATGMNLPFEKTPQSVTTLTQQRMQDENLESVIDAVGRVTGITVSNSDANRFQIQSRGLPVNTIIYDGVPVTYDNRFSYGDKALDTAIYDRIEVVRGANGLMQGAGTPSAALNLVRKRPRRDFAGELRLSTGSWSKKRAVVDVTGPLNAAGSLRGRAVYAYDDQDSFIDRYGNTNNTFYGVLEGDIGSRTVWSLGSVHQRKEADASMSGGLPLFFSDDSRTNYERSTNTAPDWATHQTEITNVFADVTHRFNPDWSLTGHYLYNDGALDQRVLFPVGNPDPITNSGMTPGSFYRIDGNRTQHTFDLKLNGRFEAFERSHEVIFGAQHRDQDFSNPYYAPAPPLGPPYSGANPPLGDFRDPGFDYPNPEYLDTPVDGYTSRGETRQTSAFVASFLEASDRLDLLLGARVTNYSTDQFNFGTTNDFEHNGEFTPYAGLLYVLTDDYSLYANYTEIFQPQSELSQSGQVLDPVIGSNYEGGVKATLFGDRLNASAAVFEIRQDNVAEQDGVVAGTALRAYRGVDGTRTRGYELEANGALTDRWQLYAGYTYAYTEGPDGERLNTSRSKQTFDLFTTYDLAGALQGLTVGGGVAWQSEATTDATNASGATVDVSQDSYVLVDLLARYQLSPEVSVQAKVNNLFDETYTTQVGFYDQYFYGAPRNFTVGVAYRFD